MCYTVFKELILIWEKFTMKITLGNLKYLILPSEKVMIHDRNANGRITKRF